MIIWQANKIKPEHYTEVLFIKSMQTIPDNDTDKKRYLIKKLLSYVKHKENTLGSNQLGTSGKLILFKVYIFKKFIHFRWKI